MCKWSKMSCQISYLGSTAYVRVFAYVHLCIHISYLIKIKLSEMCMLLACTLLIDIQLNVYWHAQHSSAIFSEAQALDLPKSVPY